MGDQHRFGRTITPCAIIGGNQRASPPGLARERSRSTLAYSPLFVAKPRGGEPLDTVGIGDRVDLDDLAVTNAEWPANELGDDAGLPTRPAVIRPCHFWGDSNQAAVAQAHQVLAALLALR